MVGDHFEIRECLDVGGRADRVIGVPVGVDDEARRLIREGARRAIERLDTFQPTRPQEPATVTITYKRPDLADIASILPSVERTGLYAVTFEVDGYMLAYQMIRVLYRNLTE